MGNVADRSATADAAERPAEAPDVRGVRKLAFRIADALGYDLVSKKRNQHAYLERHVVQVVRRLAANCVIDVGANVGQYAERLRSAGYAGRIVSFEPSPGPFERLEAASRDDPNWSCRNLALGDESGVRTMYRTRSSLLTSFLRPNESAEAAFAEAASVDTEEQVRVERLDNLFAELVHGLEDPRLFLKMDTQGCDLRVFAGAQGCLDRVGGLQSELSVVPLYKGMPNFLEALTLYRDHGFEVTGFFPVFRHEPDLVIGEFDCVMALPAFAGARTTRLTVPLE